MYAIAIIRYQRPLEEVLAVVDEHRAYLRSIQPQGMLMTSEPFEPWTDDALLPRVPDQDGHGTLERIRDGDPFTKKKVAEYELLVWAPTIAAELLARL